MSFSQLSAITFALTALVQTAMAEPVTLKSITSSVELVGELISFSNDVYIIETDLGELEVDARTVTCVGKSCPEITAHSSKISVFGNQALMHQLLVPLMENYSFSLGATIDTTFQSDRNSILNITTKDGLELAIVSILSGNIPDLKADISSAQGALVIKSSSAEMMATGKQSGNIVLLAVDALVAITSDTNPVKSISFATLRSVVSGTITNWKALGGPDAGINLYLPEKSSDLAAIAKAMGFDFTKSVNVVRFDDINALSDAAANDPYGLGFTDFTNIRTSHALSVIGECGAYIRPDSFNIATGNYPATYYHYLQQSATAPPVFEREFINYLSEDQARKMIDRQGYTSLSVVESGLENQGNRIVHGLLATEKSIPIEDFRTMMRALNGARQLSTVMRFTPDTVDLNPQSSAALDSLVSALLLGQYADQTLMIVGFTGAKGSHDDNNAKSKATAQIIADHIKAADSSDLFADLQIKVLGFGEASPLACEDTPQGIAINNRVEIWVKDAF